MIVNPSSMVRKLVSLPHALVAAIEDYRFKNRIKTESESIRRLLEIGLASPGTPFRALAIDLHLTEDHRTALLTVVADREPGLEVLLPVEGLKNFRDLIDQKLNGA
jgi:hypothetical protein